MEIGIEALLWDTLMEAIEDSNTEIEALVRTAQETGLPSDYNALDDEVRNYNNLDVYVPN